MSIMIEIVLILISHYLVGTLCAEWTDTSWSNYPYMVRLDIELPNNARRTCGGSILSTNECEWGGKGVILTAASCVEDATNINVGIGCTKTDCSDSGAKYYNDDHYVIHPSYDASLTVSDTNWLNNDIALIYLSEAITNTNARKIDLHSNINVLTSNDIIRVFGYWGDCSGHADCVGGNDADSLEYADTNYVTDTDCIWGELVSGGHDFCVKDSDSSNGLQSVCFGDSGSPLIFENKQIGLNSFAHQSCNPAYPQVATSIPYYNTWITSQQQECVAGPAKTPDPNCNNGFGTIISNNNENYCFRTACPQFGGVGCSGDCCFGAVGKGPSCQENGPPSISCFMGKTPDPNCDNGFGTLQTYQAQSYCFRNDCHQFGYSGCIGDCCFGAIQQGPSCDEDGPPKVSCFMGKTPDPNCNNGFGTITSYNNENYCFRNACPQFGGVGCSAYSDDCCFGAVGQGPSCQENGPPSVSCFMGSTPAANAITNRIDDNHQFHNYGWHYDDKWLYYLSIACVTFIFNVIAYGLTYIFCIKPKVKTGAYQYNHVNNKQVKVIEN